MGLQQDLGGGLRREERLLGRGVRCQAPDHKVHLHLHLQLLHLHLLLHLLQELWRLRRPGLGPRGAGGVRGGHQPHPPPPRQVLHLHLLHLHLHLHLGRMYLEAGKAVLCEKPLAMNLKETKELVGLARCCTCICT